MINSIDVNGKKFSYTPDRVEFLGELVNKFPNQESFGRKELKDAFDGYFPSWIKSSKLLEVKSFIIIMNSSKGNNKFKLSPLLSSNKNTMLV